MTKRDERIRVLEALSLYLDLTPVHEEIAETANADMQHVTRICDRLGRTLWDRAARLRGRK